jgi:hypothetical protein
LKERFGEEGDFEHLPAQVPQFEVIDWGVFHSNENPKTGDKFADYTEIAPKLGLQWDGKLETAYEIEKRINQQEKLKTEYLQDILVVARKQL